MFSGILTVAIGTAVLLAGRANAQISSPTSAAEASSTGLQEIVVTAQRRAEDISKVPISVTVVTPMQAIDSGIVSNQDLQLLTPGLTFDSGYGFGQPFIRGVGTNQPNEGLESAVASFVNGAYVQRSTGAIGPLYDTSVEVLRGAQGTLWGRNATGGAILYTTTEPILGQTSTEVRGEFGNYWHEFGELTVNVPITETMAVRFGGQWSHDGGYVTNLVNGSKWGGGHHSLGRFSLKWQPDDDFAVDLVYETLGDRRYNDVFAERAPFPQCLPCGAPGSLDPVTGFYNIAIDSNEGPHSPRSAVVTSNLSTLRMVYQPGPVQITSITSFKSDDVNEIVGVAGTSFPVEDFGAQEGGHTWGEDLQALTKFAGPINALVGVAYYNDTGYGNYYIAPVNLAENNTVPSTSYSGFGEIYWSPIAPLKLTAGVRYTDDNRNLTGTIPGTTDAFRNNKSFKETTPRAVIAYDFGSTNVYASYNRGYKNGGYNTPAFANAPPVNPETIDYFAGGLKYVSPDRLLRLDAEGFYYKWKNLQVSELDLVSLQDILVNAAAAHGYGADFSGNYRVSPALDVFANASFLSAKFTSYPTAQISYVTAAPTAGCPVPAGCIAAADADVSGTVTPRSPRFQGSLGGDLHAPISDFLTAHFNFGGRYTSKYDFYPDAGGPQGYAYQPAYLIVNLSGYLEHKMPESSRGLKYYRIGFYIDNANNKEYYQVRTPQASLGILDQAAPPRMFGIRVSAGL
jgi:iron complex outermembrane receptor protein